MRPFKKLSLFDFSWIVLIIGFLVMQVSTFLNVDVLYAQDVDVSREVYVLLSALALAFVVVFFYIIPTLLVLETIDLFIHLSPRSEHKQTYCVKYKEVTCVLVEKRYIKHAVFRC